MPRPLLALPALVLALASGCASAPQAAPTFTLDDDTGSRWALAQHRGVPVLLFFGYTHCPDTCPLTLAKLAKATAGTNAAVAFVTVDPQRDTAAALHPYVAQFGANVVGLTGTLDEVLSVETAYHVWAQRVPGKKGSGDYDEAHASTIFVIDSHGTIAAHLDGSESVEEIARAVKAAT